MPSKDQAFGHLQEEHEAVADQRKAGEFQHSDADDLPHHGPACSEQKTGSDKQKPHG